MLKNILQPRKASDNSAFISKIYDIDSAEKFRDPFSSIFLGNVSFDGSKHKFGPFKETFMSPEEKVSSIKAVESGITDYKIDEVIYEVNRYGFRGSWDLETDSTENSIATFGCSFTYGVGCSLENLWCEILANNLNKRLFNFGVGGTCAEHSALLYSLLSRFTRFDTVIVLVPHFYRTLVPISLNNSVHFFNFTHNYEFSSIELDTIRNGIYNLFDDTYYQYRMLSYVDVILNSAKLTNTNIYLTSWDFNTYNFIKQAFGNRAKILPFHATQDGSPFARDGSHAGKQTNHLMANIYTEILRADGI